MATTVGSPTAGTAAPGESSPAGGSGPVSEACSAVVALSGAERRLLAALPDPGHVMAERQVWCDLEGGHPGLHWGLGQVSGPDWWWLRWDADADDDRALVHRDVCRRVAGADEAGQPGEPCALPAGHAGAHSYTRPT